MKMPFFNEDVRDYSRFKSDFTRQVVPEVQNDYSAAYALKSCLGSVPLDIICNVDDDFAEMWHQLDDEFGKASKLTDVIMKDIKKMRPGEWAREVNKTGSKVNDKTSLLEFLL